MGIIVPGKTLHTVVPQQRMALVLRPFETEDILHAYNWFNQEDVYRYMGGSAISDRITLKGWQEKVANLPSERLSGRIWYTIWTDENEPIGHMQLVVKTLKSNKVAMWGASVVGPTHFRGMGVGLAAKTVLLDHAFSDLSVEEVKTAAHRDNVASLTFNKKCGARVVEDDGTVKELVIKKEDFLKTLSKPPDFTSAP